MPNIEGKAMRYINNISNPNLFSSELKLLDMVKEYTII